jgi:predicted N-acetyltransferase YhbS
MKAGLPAGYEISTDGARLDVGLIHRGKGLGTALTGEACHYLAAYGLRRILLSTTSAHRVYARAGFVPLARPEKWMIIGQE